uniref:Magnesium-dependent phosphatase 1 n=1 Tax=Chenopodium quinoa TaxID=63459 RepID=A0A803LFZ0_CHEQI
MYPILTFDDLPFWRLSVGSKPRKLGKKRENMGDERVKTEVLQTINLFQVLPKLVVFDLDYTIWPFYCECRSKREMPSLYPHVKGILYALKDKGIDVAIASRSPTPDIAKTFLDKLGIQSMFVAQINNMGATSILVDNGVNQQAFRQGLVEFSQKSKASDKAGSSGKNKKK